MMLAAIIVGGGSSTRVGFDKLFAKLAGRPVIQYSLEAFERSDCVGEIIVVCRKGSAEAISRIVDSAKIEKVGAVVTGGQFRQDSVRAGLQAISRDAELVAVHDAARPLITPAEIERVYVAACERGAATLAGPVIDTLKLADAQQRVVGSIPRENVFAMQTPQIFEKELLIAAYRQIREAGITVSDEVSAIQELGRAVMIVPSEDHNLKITYARDLALAASVLQERPQRCMG
jgi:2-C-methyl-D-erythritol 4-phosphate cytidylyltransferase